MNTQILKKTSFASIVAATAAISFATSALAASFQTRQSDFTVLPPDSSGQTITVTTLDDVSDFSGSQQVSDLPGPDGRVSFREAVTAANNTPGSQTIAFAVSPSEFWLVAGMGLLRLEQGAFFLNDSGTTVDFSTQTANMGDTNPNGPEIGVYGLEPNGWGIAAIFINGDNCVVKGLGKVYQRGYAVQIVGDNNRVIGCQIDGPLHAAISINGYLGGPTPSGNIVGGTAPGEGNTLIGLVINGPADGNIVIGNPLLVGVQVQGATRYGVIASNNRIGGPTSAERNVISGNGYYGEEGFPVGAQVSVIDADGTIVEGNYIGTTADGMQRYPQQIGPVGVEIYDSRTTTVRGNLIAGLRTVGTGHYAGQIFGQAVHVGATNSNTQDTVIENNTIGLAADGVTPIVTRSGVTISPLTSLSHAFGTLIGSNHIAGVETTGVLVASLENGVTIIGNSIHDCGSLGIDLISASGAGVTPNDPGDGDVGGNGLQNFPVILSAATTGSAVMVQGTLDSSPSAQFTVEFFASPLCDPSGFGEGAVFLGSTAVTTDGMGHAAFSLTLPAAVPVGARATATATRVSTGDTSEFSACFAVTPAVQASSVVSRKTHGGAGAFDINLPLTGTAGIECRSGGANSDHQVVFAFPTAVTLSGATVTPQAGMSGTMAGPPSISPDGRTVTLNLTNVTDAQTIAITLSGVSNGTSTNDVPAHMSLLVGDTNADQVVNSADVLQTRNRSGGAASSTNFRSDVNVDGAVNSGDTTLVRSRSGTALPAAFVIGQHYGGGIIFWIDDSGQHGLIAAESDQGFNWWGDRYYLITGATGTALGTGAVNTGRIINTQGRQYSYAALLCVDYRGGGFADWFLPSKDELYLLYQQANVVGGFIRGSYWSSSEFDSSLAWHKFFYNDDEVVSHKDRFNGVRAIRAF